MSQISQRSCAAVEIDPLIVSQLDMKIAGHSRSTLLFLLILSVAAAAAPSSYDVDYTPADNILLNCGASTPAADTDGRTWLGDVNSKYSPSITTPGQQATSQDDAPPVPHLTARTFTSPFTYTFPLSPGRKYLRLYFHPSNYTSSPDISDAVFSVSAGPTTLLDNFSAHQTAASLNYAYLIREFSLNVSTTLNLTFTPSSFAFVNGIEIVSTPDLFGAATPTLVNGGKNHPFEFDHDKALQTVFRLNVGGQHIAPSNDSGLFRSWADDSPYIYGAAFGVTYSKDDNVRIRYSDSLPRYVAPEDVYATARSMGPTASINLNYNLTWIFTVDAGFYYLFRLHLCEIQYPITKQNQRVFTIYINNQTAEQQADVIARGGGIGRPVVEDYVAIAFGTGRVDIWLALHPEISQRPQYYDAILNGLEIFKLERSDGTLAGPNPPFPPAVEVDEIKVSSPSKSRGGAMAGVAAALLLGCCIFFVWKKGKEGGASGGASSVWLSLSSLYASSNLGRHFSSTDSSDGTQLLGKTGR